MVTIHPKDLIGRTFLKDLDEDGQSFRARVVPAVLDNEDNMKKDARYMKFICDIPNSKVDEMYIRLTRSLTILKRIKITSKMILSNCVYHCTSRSTAFIQ
jgi:hypothetical protein